MKQRLLFLVVGAACGLVAGFVLARGLESEDAPPRPVASAAVPLPVPAPAPGPLPAPGAVPVPAPGAPAPAPDPLPAPGAVPAQAAVPVAVHTPQDLEAALKSKDARGALAILKDLSRSDRSAWPLAVKALIELQRSIDDDNPLGLNVTDFYKAARQDGFAPLYVDAIQHPEAYEADFRGFALREVVWTDQDDLGSVLAKQLLVEKDPGFAQRIAGELSQRPDPALLADLVASAKAQENADVRSSIIEAIAAVPGDGAASALGQLAAGEPNATLQQEIAVTLQGRNAPVAGYLVTDLVPESQALQAGIKPGDIITTYGGTAIGSVDDLTKAKSALGPNDTVVVGVVRNGQTITVTLKAGRIGIDGRAVKPRG